MKRILGLLIIVILEGTLIWNITTSFIAAAQPNEPIEAQVQASEWILMPGDWLLANVANNTLQFVREDSSGMSLPLQIGSGINTGRKMSFLDMYYDPATPERTWEVRSTHQFRAYSIYGTKESKEQLFLRLYELDEGKWVDTHYGIHTTPYVEEFLTRNDGYNSWGCLVTDYPTLKKIEELFYLNGEQVKVVTTRNEGRQLVAFLQDIKSTGSSVNWP